MAVAGIDYSTKAIDVVLLDDDSAATTTWHRFNLTGQDAFDRARAVKAAMPTTSFWDDVVACGIEDPRGYGAGSLYRVQGAILACLPRTLLVQPLIPSSWRKTVGLKGNASKLDVAVFAFERLRGCPEQKFRSRAPAIGVYPQDAFDAYCLALATRSLIELGEVA